MVMRSVPRTSNVIVLSFAYIAWALAISSSDGGGLPQPAAGMIAFADELIARQHRESSNGTECIMPAVVTNNSVKLVGVNRNRRRR